MKISSSIFLVGIIVLIVEIMIATNLEDSDNVLKGLVSEDVLYKMNTLYFFIVIILFFFGGINFYLEKRMQVDQKILLSDAEFDLEDTDLNKEYIENITTGNMELGQIASKPTDGSEVSPYTSAQDFPGQGYPPQKKSDDDPLTILKKRLAKGEITKKEYKDLKSALE